MKGLNFSVYDLLITMCIMPPWFFIIINILQSKNKTQWCVILTKDNLAKRRLHVTMDQDNLPLVLSLKLMQIQRNNFEEPSYYFFEKFNPLWLFII